MLGVVEDHRFFFMAIGLPDLDELLSSHEALKEGIRAHTERSDMKFGRVYYVSDYRYAHDIPGCMRPEMRRLCTML